MDGEVHNPQVDLAKQASGRVASGILSKDQTCAEWEVVKVKLRIMSTLNFIMLVFVGCLAAPSSDMQGRNWGV